MKDASGLGSALGADVSSHFLDVVFFPGEIGGSQLEQLHPWRHWKCLETVGLLVFLGGWGGHCWHLMWKPWLLLELLGCLGPPPQQRSASHPDPLVMKAQPSIPLVSWVPITVCWSPEVSSFTIHACTLELS